MNLKVKKKSLQTSLDKAVALQHAGELDAAEALFKQVLAMEPRQPAALYSLAALASGRSEFAKALTYIEPVVVSNPSFAQAHLAKSIIQYHLGQLDAALRAVEKAVALDAHLPNAQAHLQTVKVAMGVLQAQTPAAAAPVMALNNQAIALQSEGEHAQAIAILTQSLQLAPQDFTALYSIGISQSATGQAHAALASFARAADILDSVLARVVIWVVLAGLIYHAVAGVKHLLMDLGVGETLEGGLRAARTVFAVSAVLIIAAGFWVW